MCKLSTLIHFVISLSPWGSVVVDTLLCFDHLCYTKLLPPKIYLHLTLLQTF